MAYQQQHDNYPQSRQLQYYEQWRTQQAQEGQQAPQHQTYRDQYDPYDQQYYDYGDDQHDQHDRARWDNSYYEQQYEQHYEQQDGWGHAQQDVRHGDVSGHERQAPQRQQQQQQQQQLLQQQRQPPPPQDRYYQNHGYDERYQQPPPQQRQEPRSNPSNRANPPPSNAQQGRNGLRPPGLDRSLLNPARPKNLPQDNPFPTFPVQKSKQAASTKGLSQGMSQMSVKEEGVGGRSKRPSSRGQMAPPHQFRGQQQERPEGNGRQDSGHFENHGQTQRYPPNRVLSDQRPPPMNLKEVRAPPRQRLSDPKSPSQRTFGPNTQRSLTMPQQLPSGVHREGFMDQQQWAEPGAVAGYHGPASPTYIPPRPSTATEARDNDGHEDYEQYPPMPQIPALRQPTQQNQALTQPYRPHGEDHGALDTVYDDYYGELRDRQSMASTLDMPNFDAIPETNSKHRRGDSIDNHLSPTAKLTHGSARLGSSSTMASAPMNTVQKQTLQSRSHPDLQQGVSSGVYEMPADAPPMPVLPRANTGSAGHSGLRNGPQGRGPPARSMTTDGTVRETPQGYEPLQHPGFDPRYGRQPPPPVQRVYSDESAYSEPPPNTMRNISSPIVPGIPVPRSGTAAPAPGRRPSDPLGRRPGTAQTMTKPDALPAHPNPVRPGIMQQGQQQQSNQPPRARPPPLRQYNSEPGRTSHESDQSLVRSQSLVAHPVTHDELNRLRNALKSNPSDAATGLKFAKKLVEAASVLSDEGGTADTRTRNKNREKFILEAHKVVKKLVNSGSPDAMFYLADCYGQGLLGLQVDTKEAFNLYQSAAKGGHAASAYRTAVCCEMGHEEGGGTKRDPLKAVQWYRRSAALGDTPALYKMGMILLKGLLGQQKNFGEAINMLKRAADRADRDNPHALHELALIYEAQTGNERIIRDEAYALELFHQAADLGYKFSQFRLGQAYEYGLLGCQIDARTSIAWYTKAAAQEEHQSELALSGWYLTGTSGILEQSDTEAYLWARKAACAEPPLPKALFAMGYFTEVGIGCPRSLDEAKRWYGRAAAYKFPKAQERLEELKRGGSKVQLKRERLSRTNQKQQEENCTVM